MKWMKRISISLALIGVICIGGLLIYNEAYATGETAGYDSGYSVGQEAGYEEGYGSGKTDGYKEGEAIGYIEGAEDGYSQGEAVGYLSGETDGYQAGYAEGVEAGLGHGYALKDPTYEEVIAFLGQDETDENEYVEDTYGVYVCSHFARDVCNNAEEAGFRCAFVELRYLDGGHAIIAFDTIDEGLVYFVPQTDDRVSPVIGKRYYQCIEPKPGYYYEKPAHDDTILDILVIW